MNNRQSLTLAAAGLAAIVCLPGCMQASAQVPPAEEESRAPRRSINVTGTAVAYGKPDHSMVNLGTTKSSESISVAKKSCDATMAKVIAALRKSGVSPDNIQTSNYQMFPFQPNNKASEPRQWKVSHRLSIKVRKVDSTANVIEAAVQAGATEIDGVDFRLEKIADLRTKARAEAIAMARQKAEEIARLMNVTLGEPITIQDGSGYGYPFQAAANSSMDFSGGEFRGRGGLSGGQIAVDATETVQFAIR